jgi:hypothetical protein
MNSWDIAYNSKFPSSVELHPLSELVATAFLESPTSFLRPDSQNHAGVVKLLTGRKSFRRIWL